MADAERALCAAAATFQTELSAGFEAADTLREPDRALMIERARQVLAGFTVGPETTQKP